MLDFLGDTLCVGDRVIIASTNDRGLRRAQIIGFQGEEPNRYAIVMTDGNRQTEKRRRDIIKERL